MEKIHTYLIIFLISWILFIIPNEIILSKSLKKINDPHGPILQPKDTILDRIFFASGLLGLMLMIIIYGKIKEIMDKENVKQNLNTFTKQV